jgi:uncharacterized protein
MKISHYLKTYLYEDKPGYLLLYSTKKGSMTLLSEEAFKSLKNGRISQSDEETLSKLGIIVSEVEAEKRSVHKMIERINNNNSGLNITVVMNLDCNFACTYCYEGEMKGKLYMSDETAGRLTDFIKERFIGKKFLNLDFYGGEPLMSFELIKTISSELKSFTESRGAAYTFTLVTNGSLFTRKTAHYLASLGLTAIKTTLDGPAEVHNNCRPFKSGRGSFDLIIRNIRETCDIVKIGVGGNFQKQNYVKFPQLLDYLEREGLTPERFSMVKFDPVMKQPDGSAALSDFSDGCMSINEPWLIEAGIQLRKDILKRGYNTPKIAPMPCQVEITDSYVVNFDGAIYKCPAFIGREGFSIGHLESGLREDCDPYHLTDWRNQECTDCEYLPLCFGGCRYMSYIRDGNIYKPDCKRPYFDASLETMIKQDIKYRRLVKATES